MNRAAVHLQENRAFAVATGGVQDSASSFGYQSPWLDDELRIFRDNVRRFIREEFVPCQARWREQHAPDPDAWLKAGETGILLPDLPEEFGAGGTYAHEAVVIEELARAGVHFGSNVHSIVAHYILSYGTPEQKRRWLPRMITGELVGAIAMTEPSAGSDLAGIRTTARRDGNRYIVNGSKTFVTNGLRTSLVCVAVKTDTSVVGARGISMILCETRGLAGCRPGKPLEKVGRAAQDTCELFFDDVVVPAENLLGGREGRGFGQMIERLPYERLSIGVASVATMEIAIEITARYVKERVAFGKPLIDLQSVRFKLAECSTEAHISRVFVDSCIQRQIAGTLDSATAAMAKYWLTEREFKIIDDCVQMHGGYGYVLDYSIARMWADSRVQRIYGGANEIMKEVIGWSL